MPAMASLQEPVNFQDLISGGTVIKVTKPEHVSSAEDKCDDEEDENYIAENYKQFAKGETVFDEDTYEVGDAFDLLATKMFNLVEDGKIKKRLIRKGSGKTPADFDIAKIHYNAYLELELEPFDSTYNRNKPQKFTVNDGRILPGLDHAVQSMHLGEKSEFLIHPNYAYGKSFGRVPPDSEILFQVELIDIISCGAAAAFESLPEEKQKDFSEIMKYCESLCEKAKSSVIAHELKQAIYAYNTANNALKNAFPVNEEQSAMFQAVFLRVNSNLLVCYTKNGDLRKGCTVAKRIYARTLNGELIQIPTKVYYNHGKCLRHLGEYDEAKVYLDKAIARQRNDPDIVNEVLNLDNDRAEYKKKQTALAKALVGTK